MTVLTMNTKTYQLLLEAVPDFEKVMFIKVLVDDHMEDGEILDYVSRKNIQDIYTPFLKPNRASRRKAKK